MEIASDIDTKPAVAPEHFITEDISRYMKQIERYPRITVERESELFQLIHNGSPMESAKAKEELICSNLKLVVKIAHDFKRFGMTFADIVAEGNCGLMIAADKFDPGKGAKFSCYAAWWIKQSIRKAIANSTRTIRIPGGSAQKLLKMQKARNAYINERGRIPSTEELAALTGLSEVTITNLKEADIQTYSIDETLREDSATTFGDMLQEETDDYTVKKEEALKTYKQVQELLPRLLDREAWIIQHSYGLSGRNIPDDVLCQETGQTIAQLHCKIQEILLKQKKMLQQM